MNQKGFAEIGAILVLLAVGAAIGAVNYPPKEKIVVEKVECPACPQCPEVKREYPSKKWWQFGN